MEGDDLRAATEQINASAQIAQVEPSQIEHVWEIVSRISAEIPQDSGIGLAVARGDPDLAPRNPEQHVALAARYALLNALVEQGIFNDYMEDESLRKRVFAAAATVPCYKNDLGEALAQRMLRDSPPDVVEKAKEEMRQAGCEPDHPKVGYKLIEWMRDNC
jgi:hypothetical protein